MGLFDFLKKKNSQSESCNTNYKAPEMGKINVDAQAINSILSKHGIRISEELINNNRALLEECLSEMLKLNMDSVSDHPKIKQIGIKLSLSDGSSDYYAEIRLMQIVYYAIIGQKGDGRHYSLSYLWSGIGGWQN